MLSLFLLWPTGSTLGLVLAVLGIGIWIGVQHLNYLEFGELRRVAQRTLEQRLIFVNNLAIRRATEELKVASDFEQLCRILEAAFGSNDFDAFELRLLRPPDELAEIRESADCYCRRASLSLEKARQPLQRECGSGMESDARSGGGQQPPTRLTHRVPAL